MKVFKEKIEFLRLKGNDVQDFLQRVSTNDFRNFDDNSVRRSVFTTDKGRIVDLVTVLKVDGEYILVCSRGKERLMSDFLNKYIVSEDFELAFDKSVKYTLIPEFDHDYQFLSGCNYVEKNFFYLDDYSFRKIVILAMNMDSIFANMLLEQCEYLSDADFKSIAIENGYLYDGNELNEEINPLECGLKEFISFNKGCYIGQEVISRLDTQGKIPKVMVKINSDVAMREGDKINFQDAGTETECGFVTSAGKSSYGFTALGFIRGINLNEEYKYYINNNVDSVIMINKFKY